MKPGEIRPIAICLFKDGERILVAEYYDALSGRFYRPLGGAIRFGEQGRECIVREIREELGAEIQDLAYVGMVETIFSFEGLPGHEIVLVYRARFVDTRIYDVDSIECQEDNGSKFVARWKPISELQNGRDPLYPEGIWGFLAEAWEKQE